jgi:predicted metallo-beta-lactamase superfamily hydrolase
MQFHILAAESFGVRSLATLVTTGGRRILIDPGESVAPRRYGLPPHPLELEASRAARREIIAAAEVADTIVITHYHHDHFTPEEDRPEEFSTPESARALYAGKEILAKDWRARINRSQRVRAERFVATMGREARPADGRAFGAIRFSPAVPHGAAGSAQGWVVMVVIEGDDGRRLVHASDIQLLDPGTVDRLLAYEPDAVIVSGPALYLPQVARTLGGTASAATERIARTVPLLVIDHHYLRDLGALDRVAALDRIAGEHGGRVTTAAGWMAREPQLLEAERARLYGDTAEQHRLPRRR